MCKRKLLYIKHPQRTSETTYNKKSVKPQDLTLFIYSE